MIINKTVTAMKVPFVTRLAMCATSTYDAGADKAITKNTVVLTYSQSIGNAPFFMLGPTFTVIILDP